MKVKVAQLCPTLCDPMGYTVHEILLARILEWVAVPFSRGSSQPRDRTQVSLIAGGFFTSWARRETKILSNYKKKISNFIVGKLSRYHHLQMIKSNISNETYWQPMAPLMTQFPYRQCFLSFSTHANHLGSVKHEDFDWGRMGPEIMNF